MLIDEVKTIWPLPWFDESSPDVGVSMNAEVDIGYVTLVADDAMAECSLMDNNHDFVKHASAPTPQKAVRLLRAEVARLFGFEE